MSIDSIRFKTYNNVIDTIKCVGEQHLNIKTVTTGDIWEIDMERTSLYPLFHINPTSVDISLHQRTFNFQLFVMDLVEPNEANEQEVMSDTCEIMNDIVAIFKHGELLYGYDAAAGEEPRYFIGDDFTLEPFTERFANSVTGWVMTFSVIIENELNSCNVPIDNTTICVK
ncbi:MAG: hypothetical protein GOVbin3264_13 [Prokaryotic dsDNA virus sp.]|nr:MAG: hypothetical protein GOVbin3264_13 [Prokaryotic dsDNA virus sp.]|tara:strand:+ start:4940 stop:5449 length:510 start_codon:yes stop_codon:yes gene_type:complete